MSCYSHLSDAEREQIGLAKAVGHSIGAIAKAIGRPKSTVSRELLRNRLPSGRYSPLHAAGAYQLRRRREALIERDRALRTFVVDRLAEGWTPEQISGWLKGGNEPRLRAVGCETICAFIYRTAQQAEQLWRYLTRRHKRRRPRRSRPSRDTIKDRLSIHERPKKVDARTEGGHWEGDLIICKRTRPVLVLHERKSRTASRPASRAITPTSCTSCARSRAPAKAHASSRTACCFVVVRRRAIRRNLVQRGYLKGIIGLPPNLFYGTGIPACIVVLDKEGANARKGIFMIDASKGFIKDGNKNRLREQDIHKIVDIFTRQVELPRYSRLVPVAEISDPKNDYNLNLPRYIDSTEPEDMQDIDGHLRGGIPEPRR